MVRIALVSNAVNELIRKMPIGVALDIYTGVKASKKAYEERAETARKEAMKKDNESLVSILEKALLEIGDSGLSGCMLGLAAGAGPKVWDLIKKHATAEELARIEHTFRGRPHIHPFFIGGEMFTGRGILRG